MADNWIHERLDRFKTKIEADRQKEQRDQKAIASYDAKFDSLRARVESDIETYNRLFSDYKRCSASFNPKHDSGFVAACEVKGMIVSVQRAHPPIIKIYWTTDLLARAEQSDVLEVVADDQGEIRYKHGEEILLDISDASRIILDPILCS